MYIPYSAFIKDLMATTTKINPGSFQPFPKTTWRKILSKTYTRLKQGDLSALLNGLIADSFNWASQQKKTPKYHCNLCEQELPYFAHVSNRLRIKWHSVCPNCNSRPRHRGLKVLYQEVLRDLENPKVIHFAPEPVFYPIFENLANNYKTTDFFLDDVDFPKEDIQALSFEAESYDIALCNHVIEHVPEDDKAIAEVARILKKDGLAIFTIPGDWHRNKTVPFKDLSFNGHYRDYGMDVVELFSRSFSNVEAKDLADYNLGNKLPLGIAEKTNLAFICRK